MYGGPWDHDRPEETRFRLRMGSRVVGALRVDAAGREWTTRDGLWWRGVPVKHTHRDRWSRLQDKNRTYVYEGDIIELKGSGERAVVRFDERAGAWEIVLLDTREHRALWPEDAEPLLGWDDLVVLGTIWRNPDFARRAGLS